MESCKAYKWQTKHWALRTDLIDGELDRVGRCTGAEVVHAGLEALLPRVEVQRGQLAEVGVGHEHVERLALVDVGAAVGGHVDEVALLDLPDGLVQSLELLRDVQVTDAAVCGNLWSKRVSYILRYETSRRQADV